MKKFFYLATALVLLASCSSDEMINDSSPNVNQSNGNPNAIVFNSGTSAITRGEKTGADAATLLNNKFVFAGTKGTSATTFVFDQYNAKYVANTANTTESNSSDWEYVGNTPASTTTLPAGSAQSIKYWDYATTQYDFAAYSLGLGTGSTPTYATATAIAADTKSYTLTGSVDELMSCYISDLVTAFNRDNVNDYGKPVKFSFRSMATKIRLAFYETVPGYSVKDVQFYSASTGGTASVTPTLYTSSAILPSGSGTMTITFPTTGWDKRNNSDYNKAHVSFAQKSGVDPTSIKTFDALSNFAGKESSEAEGNYIGRASNSATYAGGITGSPATGKYFNVLPYETGTNLMLRIKYKLVSTDGSGEVITVDNATAVVPQEFAKWRPNFSYTYLFKISDMTNGSTGVDGDNNIITGLTPITLNAVVVDDEDGNQETITTVSNPSITTYSNGKVITAYDEYKTGNIIYVIVNNGTSNQTLTVGTNANLYTVTLESGAAQTINEASVANAIKNGGNASPYVVTDANGKKMTVTAATGLTAVTEIAAADSPTGVAITVNGAKFTPSSAGYYVFQYKVSDAVVAVYDSGSQLQANTDLTGYYTKSGEVYTACTSGSKADGTTTYYQQTTAPAAAVYAYKIIKVQ